MKFKLLVFSFFLIVFQSVVVSQSASDYLKKLQNKFETVKDFKADYSGLLYSKNGKIIAKFKGELLYKKSKKIKIFTKRRTIISNGNSLWTFDKKLNRVVITNPKDNPNPVSIETYLYDYAKLCNVEKLKEKESEMSGIRLSANSKKIKFDYADIWFTNDYFVKQIELVKRNNRYSVELSKVKLNQGLKNSEFDFKILKGMKVVDLR